MSTLSTYADFAGDILTFDSVQKYTTNFPREAEAHGVSELVKPWIFFIALSEWCSALDSLMPSSSSLKPRNYVTIRFVDTALLSLVSTIVLYWKVQVAMNSSC